ncbi:MAG: 30S ribosomal protein S12 methylthiotransferase RimO [Prevotella sp.]
MKRNQIDFITMGCSKNLVDSEKLMRQFECMGYTCVHDPEEPQGEVAVINTCGFIGDAKEESINMILEFAQRKQEGLLDRLYVMGCLSQRYQKELEQEIPEVDKFYGKFNFRQLLDDIGPAAVSAEGFTLSRTGRHLTTPHHYAYIKIAEGCDRHCAYCAIPLITGKHVSRPEDEIVQEVTELVAEGVREFQIIEQELTYYGVDIDGQRHIAGLVDRLARIEGVEWIRLHYAYPNQFPMELLDVMTRHDNVCKYLDIALQHISDHMLERMHRHVSKQETLELIAAIRHRVPGIHLRTTLMVGFPGETEEDFEELLQFVREARFERMGAFAYSEEDGTYSAEHYADDVPDEVKQRRLEKLMAVQQTISAEVEAQKVGQVLKVVIDRKEGDYYIGRTEFCSPEVDPEVLVSADKELKVGDFYRVRITGAEEFDLYADAI